MIGKPIGELGDRLPRELDVLQFYYGQPHKLSDAAKITQIIKQIERKYRERGIHVKGTETIRLKTKRLVKSCKDFIAKRKICCKSKTERERQEKFWQNIQNVFQVTSNTVDFNGTGMQSLYEPSDSSYDTDFDSDGNLSNGQNYEPDHDSDPDSDSDYEPSDSEDDDENSTKKSVPKHLLEQIALTKGSYRLCENLLKVGVEISGEKSKSYSLSKSTMWKQLTKLRSEQKRELHSFLSGDEGKIVIQFDGKTCKRLNERHVGSDERLIVMCHTEKGDIPLGFLALNSHSSLDCARAVLDSIEHLGLQQRVIGICCDTENVNTGHLGGACLQIEKELNKSMLYLMCRHHIFEIVLRCVFELIFGGTTGSRVTNFDCLKKYWQHIKQSGFMYASLDQEYLNEPIIAQFSQETIRVITANANSFRDDYAEFNDLVLKFLGVKSEKSFNVPGATSNSRWMQRAIYALKLYLFRNHVELHSEDLECLRRFCLFVSLIYIKFWIWSPLAVDAPSNDIQFLKELDQYHQIDQDIAEEALVAFKRHLTYLSDELILLSLFSNKVTADEKLDLSIFMIQHVSNRTPNSIKHTTAIEDIQNLRLVDFISPRSWYLFEILDIDSSFLTEAPENWDEMQEYLTAKKKVQDLIVVVNDSCERAVQLGAQLIEGKRIQTESRLQDFIVSHYHK